MTPDRSTDEPSEIRHQTVFDYDHYWPLAYNDVWKHGDEIQYLDGRWHSVARLHADLIGHQMKGWARLGRRPKPSLNTESKLTVRIARMFGFLVGKRVPQPVKLPRGEI
jgi:hypothetical protein